jgi:hypothetical protein
MNLKIVSILLLCLFGIVIAFPGYGSSARVSRKQAVLYADQSACSFPSLKMILKKCLSKGINMIEEERSSEEDECGAAVVFECIIYQLVPYSIALPSIPDVYLAQDYPISPLSIFTPPDCLFN